MLGKINNDILIMASSPSSLGRKSLCSPELLMLDCSVEDSAVRLDIRGVEAAGSSLQFVRVSTFRVRPDRVPRNRPRGAESSRVVHFGKAGRQQYCHEHNQNIPHPAPVPRFDETPAPNYARVPFREERRQSLCRAIGGHQSAGSPLFELQPTMQNDLRIR
jgi:hypothetical protein